MAGALAVVGLVALAAASIADRDAARRASTAAPGAARPLIVHASGGLSLVAASESEGAAKLAAIVADRGSAAGVRLSVKAAAGAVPPGFVAVDLEASGSEAALRALARAVEGEQPIVRFARWAIRPTGSGSLRLEARAVAPLERPQ